MNDVDSIVKMMEEEDPNALAGKGTMLRNLIMQLRKVCLHPYLFGKMVLCVESLYYYS